MPKALPVMIKAIIASAILHYVFIMHLPLAWFKEIHWLHPKSATKSYAPQLKIESILNNSGLDNFEVEKS